MMLLSHTNSIVRLIRSRKDLLYRQDSNLFKDETSDCTIAVLLFLDTSRAMYLVPLPTNNIVHWMDSIQEFEKSHESEFGIVSPLRGWMNRIEWLDIKK